MASPAQQTPEHVFKALRDRRLRSSEQGDVLRRYLRWRSVNSQISQIAFMHHNLHSTLTVAALITAASASMPEHGALPHPASPECDRAVIQQRARVGFRTPRAPKSGNRNPVFGSTPSSSTLITVAAASTPAYSPHPEPRSSTPRVSDLRTQLRNVAAARIAALVRGRAARKVAHDARSLWVARRFRATPLRSIAATDIARVARSFLSRRHFGRGGENRAAAAADAAAHDATPTSATPISAKPATRRGRRSSHTPTLVDDDSDDADGYADDDDDGSRSCLTPHSHLDLEYYSEMALAAAADDEPEDDKPDDDDYKRHMPEVVDGSDESGLPKPLTSSPPSSRRSTPSRSGDSHHGGVATDRHNDITHVGTSWSQTGDVWWTSASGDHHEIVYDYNEDEYDDDENDYHHDEEEPAGEEPAGDY